MRDTAWLSVQGLSGSTCCGPSFGEASVRSPPHAWCQAQQTSITARPAAAFTPPDRQARFLRPTRLPHPAARGLPVWAHCSSDRTGRREASACWAWHRLALCNAVFHRDPARPLTAGKHLTTAPSWPKDTAFLRKSSQSFSPEGKADPLFCFSFKEASSIQRKY